MTIHCIYYGCDEPKEKRGSRFVIDENFVYADVFPSAAEIDAFLNPPVEVKSLTEKLAAIGITLQALKEELSK